MHSLLIFGIIHHIFQLSFEGQGDFSIAMICIQAFALLSSKFIKKNNVLQVALRICGIICGAINAMILQRPISFMAAGCGFMLAMETWWTCFFSAIAIVFISLKFDVYTLCETLSFILIGGGYILYSKRQPKPLITQQSEITQTKIKKDLNKYSFEIAGSPNQELVDFNLYRKLLTSFPDGVVIIDDKNIPQFSNFSFKMLMNETSIEQAYTKLMGMKNAIDIEQDNYQQLFMLLDRRIKSRQYSPDDPNHKTEYIKLRSQIEGDEQLIQDFMPGNQNMQDNRIYHDLSQNSSIQMESRQIFKQLDEMGIKKSLEVNQVNSYNQMKFYQEINMICQNGQDQVLHVIMKPYKLNGNGYIIFILRDITHINQIAMIEKTNFNKSQMLYQVAHEFRTPLNIIMSCANSLTTIIDFQYKKSLINPILSMTGSLLGLVNDLLDVAQLKAGKFNLNYSNFKIYDLLNEIIEIMKVQAQSKGLFMKLDYAKNVPTYLISDPNRLRQIVMNLITNAIKFTMQGGITVKVTFQLEILEIAVIDSGIGIAVEEQNKLFNAFARIENVDNPHGVGLGLMISNILAQKLGDGIKVFSEGKNKGSSFSFRLDYVKESDDSEAQCYNDEDEEGLIGGSFSIPQLTFRQSEHPFIQCQCKQILIVDDVPFNLQSLEIQLNRKKIRVDSAYSGQEALKLVDNFQGCVKHQNYMMILLDLEMPIMNGYQTLKLIRERDPQQKIKVIVCSGHPKEYIEMQQFDDYLEKPVKMVELLRIINRIGWGMQN